MAKKRKKDQPAKEMITSRFELETLSELEMLRTRDDQLHHETWGFFVVGVA